MGKTTAANAFRNLGIPVFDADGEVHHLLARDGAAIHDVEIMFPGAVQNGAVDRNFLSRRVFENTDALEALEGILHPKVRISRTRFLRSAQSRGEFLAVLDIPLLFETGGDAECEATCVVSAPGFVQADRVLARPGMTPEKFAAVLSRQIPDAEKRRRADFVIPTGNGKRYSLKKIKDIVKLLRYRVRRDKLSSQVRHRQKLFINRSIEKHA